MKRITIDTLSLFALFGFTLAQPLFDLLGRYGDFFVAHGSRLSDIVLLAAIPSLLLPAGFALLEWVLEGLAPRIRQGLHLTLVAALFGLFLVVPLDGVGALSGIPAIVLATAAMPLAAWSYASLPMVRTFAAFLGVTSLIFPVLFLLNSNVQRAVASAPRAVPQRVDVTARNPVVLVIFDELPLASLLDRNLEIDADAFPNFAKLAERAWWFREATTVSPGTTISVPAILDGLTPRPSLLATQADHPRTLFSVLSESHRIRAYETVTRLWPTGSDTSDAPVPNSGFRALLIDSTIAGLHVWTPSNLRGGLPPINLNWGDFAGGAAQREQRAIEIKRDRGAKMRDFISGIRKEDTPTFHFLHILLPHFPWEFLPSGQRYGSVSTFSVSGTGIAGICAKADQWCAPKGVVDQNHERHLLQVGFVDRLVGELIEQLESEGIFDETLLVVTSDHGVSFRADQMRRAANSETLPDILPIPLFVKAPGQQEGSTSDQLVETVDIFPTILDLLDIDLPWEVDGRSVVAPASSERDITRTDRRYYPSATRAVPVAYRSPTGHISEAVRHKYATFPDGAPFRFGGGRFPWLDESIDRIDIAGSNGMSVEIENESHFESVDLSSGFIPVFLRGRILGESDQSAPVETLAISVSGVLCSLASPYRNHAGDLEFFSVLPEGCIQNGRNDIAVYAYSNPSPGEEGRLLSMQGSATHHYRLVETAEETRLIGPRDESHAVERSGRGGRLDSSHAIGDKVEFSGWAAELEEPRLAERIVVLIDGKSVFSATPSSERPGVARAARSDRVLRSGFMFSFPRSLVAGGDVRIFSIFEKGRAVELAYHEDYRWRRETETR